MSGLSKVMVVVPEAGALEARTARMLELGFSREGVPTAVVTAAAPDADTGLVVVAGSGAGALEAVRRARQALDAQHHAAPLVLAGSGVKRVEAARAGADEVVLLPTFLRDVVTIGRVLRAQPSRQRTSLVGSLAESTGVYALVRALGALGRSAVLTLIRGLRRGEIRFFHGEVTSAQVGLIHGQAAFHQLLLWTEARFEFHHEDLVRRQQIPLSPDELFADAERFLEGVRDESGSLSPSLVLEQDVANIRGAGAQIPTEVHGVLRMFDGHRVLADVLEDSPYRVFETLRVAQRAVDAGLLRVVETQRPKATWRAVLRIEEWLVGDAPPRDLTGPIARDTGPVPKAPATGGSRRKRRKKKSSAPAPAVAPSRKLDIDWGALVPRTVGADLAPLSGVVPAAHASGEIELPPTREAPREKLESVMDTQQRDRFFPADLGLEPKVVFDDAALAAPGPAPTPAPAPTAHAPTAAAPTPAADAKAIAEEQAEAEDAKLRAEAAEWTRQQAAARARADEARAEEAEELARRLAATKAKARVVGRDEVTAEDADDAAILAAAQARAEAADAADAEAGSVTAAIARVSLDDDQTSAVARVSLDDDTEDDATPIVSPIKPAAREPIPGIDDRPEARQGEIAPREERTTLEPRRSEPSILVGDLAPASVAPAPTAPPTQPIVEDLAAAHVAVAQVASTQAQAPASPDLASSSSSLAVSEVRHGAQAAIADAAAAFTDAEEAFFRAGTERPRGQPEVTAPVEKFDDLDEGYQPVGFWDRLRGKKPSKKK